MYLHCLRPEAKRIDLPNAPNRRCNPLEGGGGCTQGSCSRSHAYKLQCLYRSDRCPIRAWHYCDSTQNTAVHTMIETDCSTVGQLLLYYRVGMSGPPGLPTWASGRGTGFRYAIYVVSQRHWAL